MINSRILFFLSRFHANQRKGLCLSFFLIATLTCGCLVKFVPEIQEDQELMVVQGLITDQAETDTVKLSKSNPLGESNSIQPIKGGVVNISDNFNNNFHLTEIRPGIFITPPEFRGITGRIYTLHVYRNGINYESIPMKMNPVPPIDSIYYEKINIKPPYQHFKGEDACQIYLNTRDPANQCKYYRWDFSETWILRLLFPVENMTCWIADKSHTINIKSTVAFDDARIDRFPINYISNITDRLKTKYSIGVNQYSLNEDEYNYWEKIQSIAIQVGGLYDIIPSSVQGNIHCREDPTQEVLGYFSVSSKSSKRLFIKDAFEGIINRYDKCVLDTIPYIDPPGLGTTIWILEDHPYLPPFKVITDKKGCADCTVRGTTIKPAYWVDDK